MKCIKPQTPKFFLPRIVLHGEIYIPTLLFSVELVATNCWCSILFVENPHFQLVHSEIVFPQAGLCWWGESKLVLFIGIIHTHIQILKYQALEVVF